MTAKKKPLKRLNEFGYPILAGEPPKPEEPAKAPDALDAALRELRVECERYTPRRGSLLRKFDALVRALDGEEGAR